MNKQQATLHILCGKVAAGKSTLAAKLSSENASVLMSEDFFLSRLYPNEIAALEDYVRLSMRLRETLAPYIVSILERGISVVLDFPANTRRQRRWFHDLITMSGAQHLLHFLDTPDEICRARLRQRNVSGNHEFTVSEKQFDELCRHFAAPEDDEGFKTIRYSAKAPSSLR